MRLLARALLLVMMLVLSASAGRRVSVRRGPDAPSSVRQWFTTLDRLLEGIDVLQDFLARSSARPTSADAAKAAGSLEALLEDYRSIVDDEDGIRKAKAFLKELRGGLDSLPAEGPLPPDAARSVFDLGVPSVNRYSELMRQAALESPGRRGREPANSLATVGTGADALELPFLDVSDKPRVKGGRILSPALLSLVAAAPAAGKGEVSAVAGDRRLWLRAERVELFGDFSSSRAGAMIRLRREEPGGAALDQARFYFLTRALFESGFAVSVENGVLVALLGGESARLDPYARVELFAAAWKAYEAAESLRLVIKDYLKGSVSQDENARRLDDLAKLFAAEGALPSDLTRSLRESVADYMKRNSARETLRAEMDKNLGRWGLGSFPAGVPVGQRTIDLHYNAPVEAALARAELRRTPKGLMLDRRFAALEAASKAARKGRSLPVDLPLHSVMSRARVLGLVGADPAYGAQWRVAQDRWILLRFIRGLENGSVLWAGAWELRPGSPASPIPLKGALAELAGLGALPRPAPPSAVSSPSPRASLDPGRVFHAELLFASVQEPVDVALTYDRSKAASGDRVYATPYLAGPDRRVAARARAILTTQGGAQTAVFAGLAGVTAFDLPRGEWSGSAGLRVEQALFGPPVPLSGGKSVRHVKQRRWLVLREGDRLRLHPSRSLVELLPSD